MIDYQTQTIEAIKATKFTAVIAAINLINDARDNRRNIFVVGNGGSAATADHFVCDLLKNVPHGPLVHSLTSIPTLTAYANDDGYNMAYVNQVRKWANWGDLLIAISTSGNSPNVIECAKYAKSFGMNVIGLTSKDGGELRPLCNVELHVPTDIIEIAEDVHLHLCHMIVYNLKQGVIFDNGDRVDGLEGSKWEARKDNG